MTEAAALTVVAHGFGGRTDLPLPFWMFGYGAAAALIVSFVALGILWPVSRLEGEPVRRSVAIPGDRIGAAAVRAIGLVLFLAVFAAAAFAGPPTSPDNLAPYAIYIGLWVGVPLLSALVGNVWQLLSPFETLALAGERVGLVRSSRPYRLGYWPAAAGITGFVWLELVYPHSGDPRHLGVAMGVYTIIILAGVQRWGREWLNYGEAFGVFFSLIARIAPVRLQSGRAQIRPPFAGLARLEAAAGLAAVVLVVLGSTAFDGLTRTQVWRDLMGGFGLWDGALVATLGLAWAITVVTVLYTGAMGITARLTGAPTAELSVRFVHSLVPIALAYAIAHYVSLLLFEGQAGLAVASDPFAAGWDLFGTADWRINFRLVSTAAIAWIQAASIVAGHVAGVVLAHDRALAIFAKRDATRSQYPLLAAMVAFTVGGLALLLGG